MTKFRLLSDLHLEFGHYDIVEPDPDAILILAGDIHVGTKAVDFIENCCDKFRHVIYVLGNHEFYNQDYDQVHTAWHNMQLDNFTFLENNVVEIDGFRIFGAVLWTRFSDWGARMVAKKGMNDFRTIRYKGHKLLPEDTAIFHTDTINAIYEAGFLDLIITHHLPHPVCVEEKYKNDKLTDAFMTDLSGLIQYCGPRVWCHGHTHHSVDEQVNNTRILCNPRGYKGYELNPGFQDVLEFDLR